MENKNFKYGFTLAETLIVLVVIGIIAILMINSIKPPDQNKILFKKAYSTVEKTVQELVNDESLYPYDPNYPGFKNTTSVPIPGGSGVKTNSEEKFAQLFAGKLNVVGGFTNGIEKRNNKFVFNTSDSIKWIVPAEEFTNKPQKIIVVVDGSDLSVNSKAKHLKNEDCGGEGPSNLDEAKLTECKRIAKVFHIYVTYDGGVYCSDNVENSFLTSQSLQAD